MGWGGVGWRLKAIQSDSAEQSYGEQRLQSHGRQHSAGDAVSERPGGSALMNALQLGRENIDFV